MKKTNKESVIVRLFDNLIIKPIARLILSIRKGLTKFKESNELLLQGKNANLILSLLIAIALFIAVDKRIVSFTDKNADVLYNQKVKALYNEEEYVVEGLPDSVDVTLIGKKWDIYLAKQYPANEVVVDLKKLKPGIHKVNLKYSQAVSSVEYKVNPSVVTVKIYNKLSEKKDLTASLINADKLDAKYSITDVTLSTDSVIVKGTEEAIKKVSTVKALVDVSKLPSNISEGLVNIPNVPLVVYDASGNSLDIEVVAPKVEATLKIISPSKRVPIKVFTTGKLGNKAISSISYNIEDVLVFGDSDSLSKLDYLPVEIDVTGLKEAKEYAVNLVAPAGITSISEKTIKVKVNVGDLASKDINGVPVNYRGLSSDLIVQGLDNTIRSVTVKLEGTKENLENIDKASIHAFIDLRGLGPGEHELPLVVQGDDPKIVYSSKTKKIKIKIYNK